MVSLYQAYQAYERQAEKGVFSMPAPKAKPLFQKHLLEGLGDMLIQAGSNLLKRYAARQTMSGSPAPVKLNR